MYTAFLAGNLAGAHWLQPAKWMYYHLLDGDWGSNALSWQWVVGTFSNKKYMANQENINRYTDETQEGTFLDCSYEELAMMNAPDVLIPHKPWLPRTELPSHPPLKLVPGQPVFVYTYYQLSPIWRAQEQGNRVLLLEPTLFEQYPVSKACIDFMLELGKQITGLQVFVGSFAALKGLSGDADMYYRTHPLCQHYTGNADPPSAMVQGLEGNFPSFFSYWKRLEKQLRKAFSK
jgi:deoxyribodipyrimidine photo-lyase